MKLSLTLMQQVKLVCSEFANHLSTPMPMPTPLPLRVLHQKIKLVKCKTKAQQKLQQNAASVTIVGAELMLLLLSGGVAVNVKGDAVILETSGRG